MTVLDYMIWIGCLCVGLMIGTAQGSYAERSKIPPAQVSDDYCYKNLKNHGDRHWSADIVPCEVSK